MKLYVYIARVAPSFGRQSRSHAIVGVKGLDEHVTGGAPEHGHPDP